MKLVTVSEELLKKYREQDSEVLQENDRPYMLLVKLKYHGKRVDFAIPLRSNIPPGAPRKQYFPLPNRSTTREYCHHGIHYIKMIPIKKQYIQRFHTDGDIFSTLIAAYIEKHEKDVVKQCQAYLDAYQAFERQEFCTDIDRLLEIMKIS